MTTWVLVADSSCAKIFETEGKGDVLHEVKDFVHPESRLHEQQISSDLPGRHAAGNGGRHLYETKTGIKEHEAIKFAKEIDSQLQLGRNRDKFGKLVIVAPPHFLGVLRQNFSNSIANLISTEVNKDLVKLNSKQILGHLPATL